jgi:hypothetical protein
MVDMWVETLWPVDTAGLDPIRSSLYETPTQSGQTSIPPNPDTPSSLPESWPPPQEDGHTSPTRRERATRRGHGTCRRRRRPRRPRRPRRRRRRRTSCAATGSGEGRAVSERRTAQPTPAQHCPRRCVAASKQAACRACSTADYPRFLSVPVQCQHSTRACQRTGVGALHKCLPGRRASCLFA